MLHCLHLTYSTGTRHRVREVFYDIFHFWTDGRSTVCFERVHSKCWVITEITKSEILVSSWERPVTRFSMKRAISILLRRTSVCSRRSVCDALLDGACDFDSAAKDFSVQPTFGMRSAFFPEDFFCVLRGTQRTLKGVQLLVPRYWPGYHWYHGIRTTLGQHCTAECRARRLCLFFSKSTGYRLFVVFCLTVSAFDWSYCLLLVLSK